LEHVSCNGSQMGWNYKVLQQVLTISQITMRRTGSPSDFAAARNQEI
jgi:hypothetical protein